MSLPSYDQYKFCKADWIDALPDHWKLVRIRNLFEIKKRIVGELGYDVIAITQQGVKIKDLEATTGQFSMDYSKYQLVEIGDFAMNHMDLLTGYIDISPFRGVTSPDYRVFSSLDEAPVFNRYFLYLFQHCYRQKIFFAYGQGSSQLGRWRFPTDEFRDFHVPLPSLNEQHAIASFLDRETAKIDELVAEQERLIALLKEKRQAAISHAVTKGLNRDAPMRDSGVEWLGGVPKHWDVKPVKHLIDSIGQGWSPQCENFAASEDGQWGVLKVGCVNGGVFNQNENKALPEALTPRHELSIKSGDVLVSRANTRELVGSAAVVNKDYPSLMLCDKLYRLRPTNALCNPSFLAFFLSSSSARQQIELGASGASSSMQNISQDVLLELSVPTPSVREQGEIVAGIDAQLAVLDGLVKKSIKAIDLLNERKSALISAAVTGKIDVRGLVDTEEAA